MVNHVLSVIHRVKDLSEAVQFFSQALLFSLIEQTREKAIIDNRSVQICLLASKQQDHLRLELVTKDIVLFQEMLLEWNGTSVVKRAHYVTPLRVEQHFTAPHGLALIAARIYDEDELNWIPPLETSLCWEESSEHFLRQALCLVPIAFRTQAREACVRKAEWYAMEADSVEVNLNNAVHAFIVSTPFFMREYLPKELEALGIDPEPYSEILTKKP